MRDDFLKDLQNLQDEVSAILKALQNDFCLFSKKLQGISSVPTTNYLGNINLYQTKKTSNLLLLKQSPIARDFFMISGILSLVNEMEDFNKSLKHADETLEELIHFSHKQEIVKMTLPIDEILTQIQNLFHSKDIRILKTILDMEEQIDQHFAQNKTRAISELKEQNTQINDWINFLILSKYLEKSSDHLVRMANFIVYSIQGKLED